MTSNIGGHHLADPRLSENLAEGSDDHSKPAYRLDNIRKLLAEGFSREELVSLFLGDPLFASLAETLTGESSEAEIIEQLIRQAEQKGQQNMLLELAERYNGAKYKEYQPYYNWAVACEKAAETLKGHFRPEFLNRLDDIIYFHPLSEDHLRQILDLLLKTEFNLLKAQNLDLQLTGQAKAWLLKQNEHPEWGARPLRRLIQRHIREPMADFLLKENPSANTTISVRSKRGGGLVFETKG
jgi:ATP-dependent protease Clp ATPase subunit